MTTWADVLEAVAEVVHWKGFEKANGFDRMEAEDAYEDAVELLRVRRIDYRLTCLAHPARRAELGGPGPVEGWEGQEGGGWTRW